MRFGLKIGAGDLEVKLKKIRKFFWRADIKFAYKWSTKVAKWPIKRSATN